MLGRTSRFTRKAATSSVGAQVMKGPRYTLRAGSSRPRGQKHGSAARAWGQTPAQPSQAVRPRASEQRPRASEQRLSPLRQTQAVRAQAQWPGQLPCPRRGWDLRPAAQTVMAMAAAGEHPSQPGTPRTSHGPHTDGCGRILSLWEAQTLNEAFPLSRQSRGLHSLPTAFLLQHRDPAGHTDKVKCPALLLLLQQKKKFKDLLLLCS